MGQDARYVVPCARLIWASGSPITSTAWKIEVATTTAMGSALPTSSDAKMTMRRAMNLGSSPPSNIRANQYNAPSASESRMLLM